MGEKVEQQRRKAWVGAGEKEEEVMVCGALQEEEVSGDGQQQTEEEMRKKGKFQGVGGGESKVEVKEEDFE